jgi:general stress protein 26
MKATPLNDISSEDRSKIADFLDSHPVGVLATVDEYGDPNASTIYFKVNDDLEVTFTTKRDTKKHQNIENKSKVMLVVYDAENQSAVQLSGYAKEEKDPETAQNIYHGTLHAAEQTGEDVVPPIAKIAAGPYVAYSLIPSIVSMSEYGWGNNFKSAMEQAGQPAEDLSTEDPS